MKIREYTNHFGQDVDNKFFWPITDTVEGQLFDFAWYQIQSPVSKTLETILSHLKNSICTSIYFLKYDAN